MNAVERLLAHADKVVSLFDSLLDRQGIQGDVVAAKALYQAVEQHASAAALWQSVTAIGFAVEQSLIQAAERGEQHGRDCDLTSRAVAKYSEVIAGRNELLAAEVIRGLHARVVAESLSWWPLTDRVVSLSETLCDALDRIRDSPRRVQEVAFPSGLKVNIVHGGPVRDRASWLGEKKTFLAPAMLALRPYVNPPAPKGSTPEEKPNGNHSRVGRPQNDEVLARDLLDGWRAYDPGEGRKTIDRYLAQRPDVQALKTPQARQRKIASLRTALESAQSLRASKARQKRQARG